MLGVSGATTAVLVGYMGATAQDVAAPNELAGAPSVVVVTRDQDPASEPGVTPADTPIRLQAAPSVRRLDRVPASAPAATTHGSR